MTAARGAELFGLDAGMAIQELEWDEDTDPDLRGEIMDAIGAGMIEDAVEAVDVAALWWRRDDDDVVDGLVDAMKDLALTGLIWLLTPKIGRSGHVSPDDLAEGTATVGLSLTSSADVSPERQAHKVVHPKGTVRHRHPPQKGHGNDRQNENRCAHLGWGRPGNECSCARDCARSDPGEHEGFHHSGGLTGSRHGWRSRQTGGIERRLRGPEQGRYCHRDGTLS